MSAKKCWWRILVAVLYHQPEKMAKTKEDLAERQENLEKLKKQHGIDWEWELLNFSRRWMKSILTVECYGGRFCYYAAWVINMTRKHAWFWQAMEKFNSMVWLGRNNSLWGLFKAAKSLATFFLLGWRCGDFASNQLRQATENTTEQNIPCHWSRLYDEIDSAQNLSMVRQDKSYESSSVQAPSRLSQQYHLSLALEISGSSSTTSVILHSM